MPLNLNIGSDEFNETLNDYQDAQRNNLQNEMSVVPIYAQWYLNSNEIALHCIFNSLPFLLFVLSSMFFPDYVLLSFVTLLVNSAMVCLECLEAKEGGRAYFQSVWNYLDLMGNGSSIYFGIMHIWNKDEQQEFY